MRLRRSNRFRIRTRWGWAEARPRNDLGTEALLIARRPNPRLLTAAARELTNQGFDAVVSSPTPEAHVDRWTAAGFETHEVFDIMRASLSHPIDPPLVPIAPLADRNEALSVDRLAFDAEWAYSADALDDSLRATSSSELLAHVSDVESDSRPDSRLVGYAVVGRAGAQGFLQRIAVDPKHQGKGIGRSLVRATKQWARNRGSAIMVLNTRRNNEGAQGLYESEGFVTSGRLHVLRYRPRS